MRFPSKVFSLIGCAVLLCCLAWGEEYDSKAAAALAKKAEEAYAKKDLEKASSLFLEALNKDPGGRDPELMYTRESS